MCSVGPMLTRYGLTTPSEKSRYSQIYADAMNLIAQRGSSVNAFASQCCHQVSAAAMLLSRILPTQLLATLLM